MATPEGLGHSLKRALKQGDETIKRAQSERPRKFYFCGGACHTAYPQRRKEYISPSLTRISDKKS